MRMFGGSPISLALSRKLGEVYGVFAELAPRPAGGLLEIDYLNDNSANFEGLERLEDLVWRLDPPKWPWSIDRALARRGEALFEQNCSECHAIRIGAFSSPLHTTWATPIASGCNLLQCAKSAAER